ncbi:asparagine--tRNA ligase [Patescibacteria group bacterium]
MSVAYIKDIGKYIGQTIHLKGWVFNIRSSGKIFFLQIRDGTGVIQVVVEQKAVSDDTFKTLEKITIESSVIITGEVKQEKRSPSGFELTGKNVEIIQIADDYPIAKKAHGTQFLMDHRHIWLRSSRQRAALKLRDQIVWALRSYMKENGFVLTDSPILTPTAAEGTTTLFKTEFHGETAYLAQTGQLYIEATAAALGRVYDFGPTFRAEKSKTRRHLAEFWMLDAEAAFVEHEENLQIQENLIVSVIKSVLDESLDELKILERDPESLKKIRTPFPRLTYDEAIKTLQQKGSNIKWGSDLGAEDETTISQEYDQPVFITKYPAAIKAFYMQPDPENEKLVLNADLIAPEGYGEIIGGSERISDYNLLVKKLREFKLPQKEYEWYLDLRKYGTFPHSGFGVGLERVVAWLGKITHIRETIPFPRMLNRLRP